MSKLVVSQFVSLDGVIEDPGGSEDFEHGGWSFQFARGEDGDAFKLEELRASDSLLLGRRTYEGFAAAWPGRSGDEFSDKFNGMAKYVVSTTMEEAEWENSHVLGEDTLAEIAELKRADGGDILVNGSQTLCRTLLEHGLADEWRLMVFPVVLGSGLRLFEGAAMTRLELLDSRPVGPDGVVILTYRPG